VHLTLVRKLGTRRLRFVVFKPGDRCLMGNTAGFGDNRRTRFVVEPVLDPLQAQRFIKLIAAKLRHSFGHVLAHARSTNADALCYV
jgi:hypothetical protein